MFLCIGITVLYLAREATKLLVTTDAIVVRRPQQCMGIGVHLCKLTFKNYI